MGEPGKINRLLFNIILVSAVSLLVISCSNENVRNSLAEQNLKGKVRSLTETTYSVDDSGKINDSNFIEEVYYQYNTRGNTVEELHYWPDSVSDLITFKYDLKGRKVEKRWKDSNDYIDEVTTFRYDKKGNNIERRRSETDGSLLKKAAFKYDAFGNKTEEVNISFDDSTHERKTFRYDKDNNMIEEFSYISDDSVVHQYRYKYLEFDPAGNWLKRMQTEKNIPQSLTIREFEYY
jgi:hypothetical protein